MVSISVLLLLLAMVGAIFSMATKASSRANANNEIMGNLRALERQITQDLEGLQKESFMGIWYQLSDMDPGTGSGEVDLVRTDCIVFYTAGDHATIQLLIDDEPVKSSVARIYYGHGYDETYSISEKEQNRTLSRRAKLLAANDPTLPKPPPDSEPPSDYDNGAGGGKSDDGLDTSTDGRWDGDDDIYDDWEYELSTLDDWHNYINFPIEAFFENKFSNEGMMTINSRVSWISRPIINPADNVGLHMYFIPGCAEFKIQRWIEYHPFTGQMLEVPRWYPEEDRDGDGELNEDDSDSDFIAHNTLKTDNEFSNTPFIQDDENIKEYFNGPQPLQAIPKCGIIDDDDPNVFSESHTRFYNGDDGSWLSYGQTQVPKAIKVTVQLVDQHNRLEQRPPFTLVFSLNEK
ncbi:MAG: hypothetical protein ACYTA5_20715 [Planctomycetota bacterium]